MFFEGVEMVLKYLEKAVHLESTDLTFVSHLTHWTNTRCIYQKYVTFAALSK